MTTGQCPHSLYCWALPAPWCLPRYGRFNFPASAKVPLRSRRICFIRASISADHTKESDDAYQQFADMLGGAAISNPKAADATSAAYAEFADKLGLHESDSENNDPKKSVAKSSTKKVDIDPEDYNIFDEMLERTGGRGKKPVKGAKPYSRYVAKDSKRGMKPRSDDSNAEIVNSETTPDTQKVSGFFLTEEEKAQAYAVMMEEFGAGSHDAVETWTPDDDVDDVKAQSSQLMKPPERPGVTRPVEPTTQTTNYSPAYSFHGPEDAEADIESITLQPRPARPFRDSASPSQEGTKTMESENDGEAPPVSPSEPPLGSGVAKLDPETSPLREPEKRFPQQDEQEHKFHPVQLSARPTHPRQVHILSERLQVPVEGGTSEMVPSAFDAQVQPSQQPTQVAPSVLAKPQRLQESLNVSAAEDSGVKSNRKTDRRKRFVRKHGLRKDEPPEILKNPKLVYSSE